MKISTILIIALLAITFIPTNVAKKDKTFNFDKNKNEGYIAYIVNSSEKKPDIPDLVEECDCAGSKVMVHGDGHTTPCQCFNTGDGKCKCSKVESVFLEEDKFKTKQIIMFTSDYCPPCKNFKQQEIPKLQQVQWKVGPEKDSHLRLVDINEDNELYQKYGKNRSLPLFILFEKEKETKSISGYISATKVCDLWNK